MTRRPVEAHARRVADLVAPALERVPETVPLAAALGRLLLDPARAAGPMPPFRNSQMDGYAARAADLAGAPVVLPVDGVVPAAAGAPPALAPGRLQKVMTGAPLPDGADCVVPVERAEPADGGVRILDAPAAGAYVREAGSDADAGAVLVRSGVRLAPRHLAAAAAGGADRLVVARRPRVAVLATGAEVVPPGAPLAFGQVHDVNGTAIAALVAEHGGDPVLVTLTPDDPTEFAAALHEATAAADLVLTAGGVSQGDFEVVRQVLEPLGADVAEVAMQPGGPQGTAVVDGVPVLCFPGNPVSAQVSFTVFLRPLLRAAAGLDPIESRCLPLTVPVRRSPAGRRQWLRGVRTDGGVAPAGGPGSHLVAAMAAADVLIDVPEQTTGLDVGEVVAVLPL
ncbi:gephyrin-like molybdotransferase Glp [Amnibacterium endophyticum]|uniref:Molybdopterin molybdenumtransferase n=1 Tax=Amnibacterium endophyticum TaxID=2109337 RepID=A0ABW4LAT5_9MICO